MTDQCQQHVLSFPAFTHLQLELKYYRVYAVLWQQGQAPFAKGYLSSGSQRCRFHHRWRAAIKQSSSQHLSLISCTLSLHRSSVEVSLNQESETIGVFVARSRPALSMLAVYLWCCQVIGQLMYCSFH